MSEVDIKHIHDDVLSLKNDVTLIKNILYEECELSEWAKKELAKARKVPDKELIDLREVKKRILK